GDVLVDKRRGAEGDGRGESDLPSDQADRLFLDGDVPSGVLARDELAPLGKDVRPEELDRLGRGWPGVDGDVIDAVQRGDHLGADLLGEGGPADTFVDVLVG